MHGCEEGGEGAAEPATGASGDLANLVTCLACATRFISQFFSVCGAGTISFYFSRASLVQSSRLAACGVCIIKTTESEFRCCFSFLFVSEILWSFVAL